MNSYKNLNNIFGWLTFLVGMIVYTLTVEPSVSLWDCGEFISASYKLQVVHPPGAPFFLLVGRIFSMFAPSPSDVAWAVNMLSVTTSALTVMFTFWITTYFGRKLISKNEVPSGVNSILIIGAGLIAGLTLTFADTFWFSAVEAEVYALSSFFTALTFWVMLKWEENSDKPDSDKYIVFAFFLVGLAIGTHLLNLLVIPAMAYIFYFKRFKETNRKGLIYTFLIGLGILFFIQKGIIPGLVWLIAYTDKAFVNGMGMPFWSGAIFVIIAVIGLVAFGIIYSIKNNKYYWNLGLLCLSFVLIGYSSYTMVVVRSSANPAIDMNDPEDPFNLLSYINREQYGDRPLVYGPYYNAQPVDRKVDKIVYKMSKDADGNDVYVEAGEKISYVYDKKDKTIFPRMGDSHKEGGDRGYRFWSGMDKEQKEINILESQLQQNPNNTDAQNRLQRLKSKKPSFASNIKFFVNYQIGYMWFRYFMWNFAGRQNEQQGHSYNHTIDGNWISGIGIIDNLRLGKQSKLPEEMAANKGRNKYYLLPLLLGIIGMYFHYKKGKGDFIVTTVLFLFTGILIIVFLNQPPFEPRERDYTNVGSTQTFCIWVGLGVIGLANFIRKYVDLKIAAILSIVVALFAAPILMASENWDDHDRSERYLGIDFANNYLESLAPNAILFCNGDNDTYPLWYAQNVEGQRTDVRIVNMALLPTDWYAGALLRKVYDSDPLPLTVTMEQLKDGDNDVIYYSEYNKSIKPNAYYPLEMVMDYVLSDDKRNKAPLTNGEFANYLPTKKFKVAIDKEAVKAANVVMEKDYDKIVDEMLLDYPNGYMTKGEIVLFDFIAQNAKTGWKRPIYFTATTGSSSFINLQSYFQQEGLVHRLVPIKSPLQGSYPTKIADDILYKNIMEKFKWSGIKEKENFFLDDKASLVPQNERNLIYRLASDYYSQAKNAENQNAQLKMQRENGVPVEDGLEAKNIAFSKEAIEKAKNLINKSFTEIPIDKVEMRPDMAVGYLNISRELGMTEIADKVEAYIVKNAEEYVDWIGSVSSSKRTPYMRQLVESYVNAMRSVSQIAAQRNMENAAALKTKEEQITADYNKAY